MFGTFKPSRLVAYLWPGLLAAGSFVVLPGTAGMAALELLGFHFRGSDRIQACCWEARSGRGRSIFLESGGYNAG